MLSPLLALLTLAPAAPGAAPAEEERAPSAPFTDRSAQALPGVVTTCGSPAKDYILEVNGGGLVLGDFDADGHTDLVVIDGSTLERVRKGEPGLPPRLFLNDGKGNFKPAGEAFAMAGGRWAMGGAAGDVNGDGFLDLFVTEWGPDRLFLNDGGKGFVEATEKAGFTGKRWGTSAAFLDYDGDGNLDLVVCNYLAFRESEIAAAGEGRCKWKGHAVMCGPEGLSPVHDQLYRGAGDGTFEDVTLEAGFRPSRAGFSLGVMTLDYDRDGDTDVYVTNDSTPNHLWENRSGEGDGEGPAFVEVGIRRGVGLDNNGKEQAGMGIACGDYDGNGRSDLFVTNFSGENNALYRCSERLRFVDRSHVAGLGGPSIRFLGWGTHMADFDLDGDLDLVVSNGHVYPQADAAGTDTSYAQTNHFYANDGQGSFRLEPLTAAEPWVGRAAAAADFDSDGDLDLALIEMDGPVHVLENRSAAGADGHWLRVRLRAPTGNRDGIGARVSLRIGERVLEQEIRTAGGFQSSTVAEAHFGLGSAQRFDGLVVRWPSGREQELEGGAADRLLVIEEEAPR